MPSLLALAIRIFSIPVVSLKVAKESKEDTISLVLSLALSH